MGPADHVLLVAHHGFDTRAVEDFQDIARVPDRTRSYVPKDHVEIGASAHEIKHVAFLCDLTVPHPGGAFLMGALGLNGRDGLQHSVVRRTPS